MNDGVNRPLDVMYKSLPVKPTWRAAASVFSTAHVLGRPDTQLANGVAASASRREREITRPCDRRRQRLRPGEVAIQDLDCRIQQAPRASRITSQHANGRALLVQEPGNQESRPAGTADHEDWLLPVHPSRRTCALAKQRPNAAAARDSGAFVAQDTRGAYQRLTMTRTHDLRSQRQTPLERRAGRVPPLGAYTLRVQARATHRFPVSWSFNSSRKLIATRRVHPPPAARVRARSRVLQRPLRYREAVRDVRRIASRR